MKITVENYQEVFASLLDRLDANEPDGIKSLARMFKELRTKVAEYYEGGVHLQNSLDVLKIGVVGRVKAGKSSFLNSLFFDGESVLPRASTPMTAGLTVLQYGDANMFEVEYYNEAEWRVFTDQEKEYQSLLSEYRLLDPSASDEALISRYRIPDHLQAAHELVSGCSRRALNNVKPEAYKEQRSFTDIRDLQDTLERYVGAQGEFTPITKCLSITLHDERLRGIQVVDTPGVNDPVVSREIRTREFLRGCHGVLFLSYSGSFFDSNDVSFLTHRIGHQGIGQVVLIASKFDSVLQDVGKQFYDDLGNAIEDCQSKLKRHYLDNIRTSDYRGKDPILDFSSGIGYSIYKKPSNEWDTMESHVVGRMKELYPSFFSNEQEIKETFKDLAQIDVIRQSYVENLFKSNKDSIIREKINQYFANAENEISSLVSKTAEEASDFEKKLREADISSLRQESMLYSKVISDIKSDMMTLSSKARDMAEAKAKDCLNSFSFHWNGKVPTLTEFETYTRLSTFLEEEKSFTDTFEKPDIIGLVDLLTTNLTNTLNILSENWKSGTKEIFNMIADSLSNVIAKNEERDTSGVFDGHMLRNELDQLMARFQNNATLDTRSVREGLRSNLTQSLSGKDSVTIKLQKQDEATAKMSVRSAYNTCTGAIRTITLAQVDAVQATVSDLLKHSVNDCLSILVERKDTFVKEISDRLVVRVNELEEDLKQKEESLAKAVEFRQVLQSIIES